MINLMGSASRPRCSTTSARPTTTWRRRSWTTCSPSTTWKIDDKGIQSLLKEVQSRSLVIALKGRHARDAREDVQNMSTARRRDAARGPGIARPGARSEVEAEQKEMLKIVRRLADEGQIVLIGGGDDEFL